MYFGADPAYIPSMWVAISRTVDDEVVLPGAGFPSGPGNGVSVPSDGLRT